jgi:hypothetical protein
MGAQVGRPSRPASGTALIGATPPLLPRVPYHSHSSTEGVRSLALGGLHSEPPEFLTRAHLARSSIVPHRLAPPHRLCWWVLGQHVHLVLLDTLTPSALVGAPGGVWRTAARWLARPCASSRAVHRNRMGGNLVRWSGLKWPWLDQAYWFVWD